jgi:hypothetical protein
VGTRLLPAASSLCQPREMGKKEMRADVIQIIAIEAGTDLKDKSNVLGCSKIQIPSWSSTQYHKSKQGGWVLPCQSLNTCVKGWGGVPLFLGERVGGGPIFRSMINIF